MVTIIDYGMGNLGSIRNMLHRLGIPAEIRCRPEEVGDATRLVLPGVGAFDEAMKNLRSGGWLETLDRLVIGRGVPTLGICLGMQLFSRESEEGRLPGLGWIDARTVRFGFSGSAGAPRVPHMGWNRVNPSTDSPLLEGLGRDSRFYFVHSYHLLCRNEGPVIATTCHGIEFPSAVAHRNIFGTQFHPEKSHRYGMRLLKNFATWGAL